MIKKSRYTKRKKISHKKNHQPLRNGRPPLYILGEF